MAQSHPASSHSPPAPEPPGPRQNVQTTSTPHLHRTEAEISQSSVRECTASECLDCKLRDERKRKHNEREGIDVRSLMEEVNQVGGGIRTREFVIEVWEEELPRKGESIFPIHDAGVLLINATILNSGSTAVRGHWRTIYRYS